MTELIVLRDWFCIFKLFLSHKSSNVLERCLDTYESVSSSASLIPRLYFAILPWSQTFWSHSCSVCWHWGMTTTFWNFLWWKNWLWITISKVKISANFCGERFACVHLHMVISTAPRPLTSPLNQLKSDRATFWKTFWKQQVKRF